ncbi:MAG: hypothetical protein U1E42_04390 [Rhodospirillales bacterium]
MSGRFGVDGYTNKGLVVRAAVAAGFSLVVLAGSPAAASNPLMKTSGNVQIVADGAMDDVKGSGYYSDYYGYYGNLFAYYAYLHSYYGRYYYASNSSESTNSYYNAYLYSSYATTYNAYAYVYSAYGY